MGAGANKVVSRNSIIYRHPLAVVESIRYDLPFSPDMMMGEKVDTIITLTALMRAIERMFADTEARDELIEDFQK